MSDALVPASTAILCGVCGDQLVCSTCATGDLLNHARIALHEVVRGVGGRNSTARVTAALALLDGSRLAHLSDEDLLAEVGRRAKRLTEAAKKG